jgi:hypothetical protein
MLLPEGCTCNRFPINITKDGAREIVQVWGYLLKFPRPESGLESVCRHMDDGNIYDWEIHVAGSSFKTKNPMLGSSPNCFPNSGGT